MAVRGELRDQPLPATVDARQQGWVAPHDLEEGARLGGGVAAHAHERAVLGAHPRHGGRAVRVAGQHDVAVARVQRERPGVDVRVAVRRGQHQQVRGRRLDQRRHRHGRRRQQREGRLGVLLGQRLEVVLLRGGRVEHQPQLRAVELGVDRAERRGPRVDPARRVARRRPPRVQPVELGDQPPPAACAVVAPAHAQRARIAAGQRPVPVPLDEAAPGPDREIQQRPADAPAQRVAPVVARPASLRGAHLRRAQRLDLAVRGVEVGVGAGVAAVRVGPSALVERPGGGAWGVEQREVDVRVRDPVRVGRRPDGVDARAPRRAAVRRRSGRVAIGRSGQARLPALPPPLEPARRDRLGRCVGGVLGVRHGRAAGVRPSDRRPCPLLAPGQPGRDAVLAVGSDRAAAAGLLRRAGVVEVHLHLVGMHPGALHQRVQDLLVRVVHDLQHRAVAVQRASALHGARIEHRVQGEVVGGRHGCIVDAPRKARRR